MSLHLIRQVYEGKTIGRILFNREVAVACDKLSGDIVDLGGGGAASYYAFLPRGLKVTRTNVAMGSGIDVAVDLNQKLPFKDASFDAALLFNVLYILNDPRSALIEIRRILKPGGTLHLASPFISNEMPEPHDFRRFTAEGLEVLFRECGFTSIEIRRYGDRGTSAVYLLDPFFVFKTVRLIVYSLALLADKFIPARIKKMHPAPIGYMVMAHKS